MFWTCMYIYSTNNIIAFILQKLWSVLTSTGEHVRFRGLDVDGKDNTGVCDFDEEVGGEVLGVADGVLRCLCVEGVGVGDLDLDDVGDGRLWVEIDVDGLGPLPEEGNVEVNDDCPCSVLHKTSIGIDSNITR